MTTAMNHTRLLHDRIERHRFFSELDDRLRPLLDAADITLAAATFAGRYLDVDRCVYAEVEDDGRIFNVTGNYVKGASDLVGRYTCPDLGSEFLRESRLGLPFVVADVAADARLDGVRLAYRALDISAVIGVPLIKEGRFVASMLVHQLTPRVWTEFEVELVEGVAHRCWESIQRSRITRELRESEAKFRTITNAMPQMVWTALADGSVDYHNEHMYEYVGLAGGTVVAAAWAEVVHPDDRAPAARTWNAAVASGSVYESAYRVRHRSGEYRWTLARALPVRDEHGHVVKWLGTNTDIHEQKRTEQALQDANRRKDEFLAMLGHELRNPLAPISAAADLLSAAGVQEPRVRRVGDIIRRQVRHLTGLVDDLLDASRVTQGFIALNRCELDMRQVVADAAEQVRPLVEQRRHALSLQLAGEPVFVNGDHKRLVQVLVNLLGNAAKYTPDGGRIELALRAGADEVSVAVRDDGIGMSDTLVRDAFDLFHQGERTADRTQGGLGIGLALVKSLVEQHHGKVTASSAGPGLGSQFVVRLPRVRARAAAHAAHVDGDAPPPPRQRILVVDDNVDAAQMVAMLLEALGNEVAVAHDPLRALECVRAANFDAFILDIGLPGMDGHMLARRIRELPRTRAATFIALTGYGQEQDRDASAAAGFQHHFVKPADIDLLAQALARPCAG
jgi:PAS domain S-box-containing protein